MPIHKVNVVSGCYFGEEDDQWDFCDCSASAAGSGKLSRAHVASATATAQDWQQTDRTDADGNPLQRMDMKSLMLQGKITKWWWDVHNPSSTRLTDQDFDSEVGSHDYFVRLTSVAGIFVACHLEIDITHQHSPLPCARIAQGVMFFTPTCEYCKDLGETYEKVAAGFKRRRTDIGFGRVNCGHGDQTYRPPTEEELEAQKIPGEYFDENGEPLEGAMDGEIVCNWYNIKQTPLVVLFNPNTHRPKRLDAPRTLTGITDWINEEIKMNHDVLGRDETVGLTEFGLETLHGQQHALGCADVRAANSALRTDIEQFGINEKYLQEKGVSLCYVVPALLWMLHLLHSRFCVGPCAQSQALKRD